MNQRDVYVPSKQKCTLSSENRVKLELLNTITRHVDTFKYNIFKIHMTKFLQWETFDLNTLKILITNISHV